MRGKKRHQLKSINPPCQPHPQRGKERKKKEEKGMGVGGVGKACEVVRFPGGGPGKGGKGSKHKRCKQGRVSGTG